VHGVGAWRDARKWAPCVDPECPVAAAGKYALTRIRIALGESPTETERRESDEQYQALTQVWHGLVGGGSHMHLSPAARKSAIALLNERVEEGETGTDFGEMLETGPKPTLGTA
jgi:hypothetical protein